ncbi:MAG: polynucleotide adenylyltransferase PcnB, partial [Acinetobacter pseudolwoffii]|nr:polynucleotide adenylyltransferase PcnB [Acinetobacter pseudolwoffii]
GSWWDAYQQMSRDEKERAISQYNRQRAKSRRKASQEEHLEQKLTQQQDLAEIEPLVNEPEPRNRRVRKAKFEDKAKTLSHVAASASGEIGADHPIMKRKRVQRDLSQVVFGPTQ